MSMKLGFTNAGLLAIYKESASKYHIEDADTVETIKCRWLGVVEDTIKNVMVSGSLRNQARLREDPRAFHVRISVSELLDGQILDPRIVQLLINTFLKDFNDANAPEFTAEEHEMDNGEMAIGIRWYLPREPQRIRDEFVTGGSREK